MVSSDVGAHDNESRANLAITTPPDSQASNSDKLTTADGPTPATTTVVDSGENEWQRRTMPWMLGMLVALSAVFVLASIAGALLVRNDFHTDMQSPVDTALKQLQSVTEQSSAAERLESARFLTLASLDARLIELRYHQTSSQALASIWTRFMGYLTGMILALVGAIFVLGKIRDPTSTTASGSGNGFQASFTTTWPGLVLVAFGTLLMIISSQVRTANSITEAPLFTQRWLSPGMATVSESSYTTATAPPSDLTSLPCAPNCSDTSTASKPGKQ
jgi:hypothetical protein